ncbi:hypothetical protein CCP3SC1AL1_2110001 [Gammaproteobacteria bacterium]
MEERGITVLSPKIVHFIKDFGHEDADRPEHVVLNRLFKIDEDFFYPDGEHPVLRSMQSRKTTDLYYPIIYHLAYCREVFYLRDRYLNHLAKSEIHTSDFLQDWYYKHITGSYPIKEFDIHSLPRILTVWSVHPFTTGIQVHRQ